MSDDETFHVEMDSHPDDSPTSVMAGELDMAAAGSPEATVTATVEHRAICYRQRGLAFVDSTALRPLWTGYVTTTRHFRRDVDVAVFMATVSPIAAVAVLPLAITNGDVFGMSGTGWTYMLILTLLTGVAAHGLMIFAQRTVPIGTIGTSQVIQPPLAFVWSFLLLGERLNGWQLVGIAIVLGGLLAFLTMNQRPNRPIADMDQSRFRTTAAGLSDALARDRRRPLLTGTRGQPRRVCQRQGMWLMDVGKMGVSTALDSWGYVRGKRLRSRSLLHLPRCVRSTRHDWTCRSFAAGS